jgi:sec-independent protein translocase protein TatC
VSSRPPRDDEMPFLSHLEELRRTILAVLLAAGICAIAAWSFSDRVLTWLIHNTSGEAIFTRPEGAFMARLKVSLVLGLLAALPYVFYKLWAFVGPGLLDKERRIVLPGALSSLVLFYLGLVFSYFVMTPLMVKVLIGFGTTDLKSLTEVNFLLDMVFMMGLASGLVFQLPLIVGFLTWIGLLNPKLLRKYWRHSIVGIAIASAVLTPADPVSMIVLAIPLLALYVVSLVLASMIYKARRERLAQRAREREAEDRPAAS